MPLSEEKSRWTVLALTTTLLFANYYCFELPGTIKDSLEQRFSSQLSSDEYEYFFNSLYSLMSMPNVILPFLSGYLIDRFGFRKVLFCLVSLVTLGQIVFSYGLTALKPWVMILGRFIYGLGTESILVADNILLSKLFQERLLSLAIGLNIAIANVGGLSTIYFTPRLAGKYGIDFASWVASFVCIGSLICCALALLLDVKLTRSGDEEKNSSNTHRINGFRMKDLALLGRHFWYLTVCSVFFFPCIFSWINVGVSYLIDMWYYDLPIYDAEISAGTFIGLYALTTVIFCPIVGYFVENSTSRVKMLFVGSLLLLTSMILLLFIYPFVPVILLGIAFAVGVASIYPLLPQIVPFELLGKANGLINSLQNLSFVIHPYVIAVLKVNFGSYTYSQVFLICSSVITTVFAFLAYQFRIRSSALKQIPLLNSVEMYGFHRKS